MKEIIQVPFLFKYQTLLITEAIFKLQRVLDIELSFSLCFFSAMWDSEITCSHPGPLKPMANFV